MISDLEEGRDWGPQRKREGAAHHFPPTAGRETPLGTSCPRQNRRETILWREKAKGKEG